jgi:hypothetical protein
MSKKKTEPPKKEKEEKKVVTSIPLTKEEPEKPFDFGGLPQRDLKKSLGCG